MTKIILISDIHMTKPGQRIVGLDPAARLSMVLDDIRSSHADAAHIILMGDLVHRGSRTEYRRLQNCLTELPAPVTFMPGNHDRRAGFADVFGVPFAPSIIDTDTHQIICLDTLDENAPDTHSGVVEADQIELLRSTIIGSDKPAIVITHHPIGPVGFDGMDAIALRNGAELARVLRDTNQVEHVISGHIHRAISGSFLGVPFSIVTSPCHQMPLVLGPGSSALSDATPGGYGILLLGKTGGVLHDVRVGQPNARIVQDTASVTPPAAIPPAVQ